MGRGVPTNMRNSEARRSRLIGFPGLFRLIDRVRRGLPGSRILVRRSHQVDHDDQCQTGSDEPSQSSPTHPPLLDISQLESEPPAAPNVPLHLSERRLTAMAACGDSARERFLGKLPTTAAKAGRCQLSCRRVRPRLKQIRCMGFPLFGAGVSPPRQGAGPSPYLTFR
jgi:hypothetical protein